MNCIMIYSLGAAFSGILFFFAHRDRLEKWPDYLIAAIFTIIWPIPAVIFTVGVAGEAINRVLKKG